MKISEVKSERAPKPVGLYPHSKRVGDLLFLSGIGPREPVTNKIPQTFEEQCRSVFHNVKLVLEDSGYQFTDLVDVTVFLTDMKSQFEIYNKLYSEYFREAFPTRTTVEVNRLPTEISIELKCIAALGGDKT